MADARLVARTALSEDTDLLLFGRHHLHVGVREFGAGLVCELLEDALDEPGSVSAFGEHRAEINEREVDGGILQSPAYPRLLGHVVGQVGELVLGPQLAAVLSHHRADDVFRGFQNHLLRNLVVALVCHADGELVPDERGVLRVVEHVPLQDLAVRDRDVAAGEAVAVQQAAELADRRVHRGDFDGVPFRLVHLDPVAEFVEPHRHEDDPSDDVQERLLHDVDQGRGDERGPQQAELLAAAPEEHEQDQDEGRSPDDVGNDLEMGEDVRLVSHVAAEGRAEHRTEDLEEGLRRHEDRDDVDPRTQGPQVHAGDGQTGDRDDPAEDEDPEQDDERDADPKERSRLSPGRDLHTWSERGPRYLMTVPRLSLLKGVTSSRRRNRPAGSRLEEETENSMAPRDVAAARVAGVSEHVIEVRGLVKRYPDITAVDGIDFDVNRGEVFSLLGPNGAGKTTTVEILEGLRDPTAGEARVLGQDVRSGYRRIRERVGVVPQDFEPFDRLRPREAVAYWARLFDHDVSEEAVASILETVGLLGRADTFALNLSGGEKRRLGIAMALVGQPDLLFLDEPTTGLDPGARRELWTLIGDLKRKGRTILLTTHYLDEAEQLADDVAIMNHGKIVAHGSPSALISQFGGGTTIVLAGAGRGGSEALTARGIAAELHGTDVFVHVPMASQVRPMLAKLASIEIPLTEIYTKRSTLEDVFLKLVGARMEEGVLAG